MSEIVLVEGVTRQVQTTSGERSAARAWIFWDARDIYFLGNGHTDEWVGPKYINHDITLFKNFVMARGRNAQVRIELYNAFNSTRYSGVGTTTPFDFVTGAQTNANFGKITNARNNPRIIQIGFRFTF